MTSVLQGLSLICCKQQDMRRRRTSARSGPILHNVIAANNQIVSSLWYTKVIDLAFLAMRRVVSLVRHGNRRRAVAAIPRVLVRAELADGSLAALDWEEPWLSTNYGFVYPRDRTLSPAARAFIDEVRATEQELVAGSPAPGRNVRRSGQPDVASRRSTRKR